MLEISARVQIPEAEFSVTFVRSSGPGGQNVNKVSTKAVVRWAVQASPSLPDDVKERFLAKHGSKLTVEGELVISSQKYRSQERNLTDCHDKIVALVREVLVAPKKRRPTKPSKSSIRRRLEEKKKTSQRKSDRRNPRLD
ncbi:MAG: aminoacyl-tRNA hydrolase [Planctomycetales bacterium]|nr:aminoacyl-tRNA hydrolase [Planctomycetales bacterium]